MEERPKHRPMLDDVDLSMLLSANAERAAEVVQEEGDHACRLKVLLDSSCRLDRPYRIPR